jgi:outer membrane protease
MVSRLTYGGLKTHTGEVFGRLDHTSGVFLKGLVGAGSIVSGNLNDEDFPPVISPYSSTSSDQKNGGPAFVNVDAGINFVKGGDFRIGAFVGYHYLGEKVSAYGCSQIATNPAVCAGTIPSSVLVITQNNNWHALRLGLDAELALFDRMKLNLDAAWLPIVRLNGQDFHWLRIGSGFGDFTGSLPEDGNGRGYQLEAVLSYKVTDTIDIGVGGRYWHMQTAGNTHFENHVVGFTASPQPVNWKTDHYGVFLQANFRFGPYPAGIN